jgi:hypothetical protein
MLVSVDRTDERTDKSRRNKSVVGPVAVSIVRCRSRSCVVGRRRSGPSVLVRV